MRKIRTYIPRKLKGPQPESITCARTFVFDKGLEYLQDPRYTNDPREKALIDELIREAVDQYENMTQYPEIMPEYLVLRAVALAIKENMPYGRSI